MAGDQAQKPADGEQLRSSVVRVAVEVKEAAAELAEFGYAIRSLGLASWTFGVGFAATAIGLRFVDKSDMEAPEFVSCFIFASLLVIFGILVYILESRGYVRLVSEIAEKEWPDLNLQLGDSKANGQASQIPPAPPADELTTGNKPVTGPAAEAAAGPPTSE